MRVTSNMHCANCADPLVDTRHLGAEPYCRNCGALHILGEDETGPVVFFAPSHISIAPAASATLPVVIWIGDIAVALDENQALLLGRAIQHVTTQLSLRTLFSGKL